MNANFQYLDFQIPIFFEWNKGIKYKIVTKGRRTGITRGGAVAFIEILLDQDGPILWGDTIHANIDKYWQRYFLPELKANNIRYHWSDQKKTLTINDQYMDFRSADNPENWEGFGYKYIFLNEAGIILKNRDLYTNTVLPMMLDFPDSKLIAAGVPKGMYLKDGSEHPFFSLTKKADTGNPKYQRIKLTSFDNPILSPDDIRELEFEIAALGSESSVRQEIYGEFTETDSINPFAHQYDPIYHESLEAKHNQTRPVYVSIDFNLNPFAVTFWHFFQDQSGYHFIGFDEAEIAQGSIPEMITLLQQKVGHLRHMLVITGDAMGNQRQIALKDNATHYQSIQRGLGLARHQMQIPANPTHVNSRDDVNRILFESKQPESKIQFIINPKTMPNTCRDFRNVQCDAFGGIMKGNRKDLNQRGDFIDCSRYFLNLTGKPIILRLGKQVLI